MEETGKDGRPVLKMDPTEEEFYRQTMRGILGAIVVESTARDGSFGQDAQKEQQDLDRRRADRLKELRRKYGYDSFITDELAELKFLVPKETQQAIREELEQEKADAV